jgi:hypothetical protein
MFSLQYEYNQCPCTLFKLHCNETGVLREANIDRPGYGGFADVRRMRPVRAVVTKQVEQLRAENQRLRSLLAEGVTPQGAQTAIAPSSATMLQRNADQQGLTHWLTLSSSKRHNSGCRYYRNSRGRPCGPDEGIPCKICGG